MHTHLINLDRTPDRLAEFYRVNPHLKNIARFSAIDGATISREKLVQENIFAPDVQYTAGAIGCALSHLRLWNIIMNGNEPATIAEDDTIFHHDFEQLAPAVIAGLPRDWDMIVWAWNMKSLILFDLFPGFVTNFVHIGTSVRQHTTAFQTDSAHRNAHKLTACFGTPCYSISPAGARKLTQLALPIRHFEIPFSGLSHPLTNMGIDVVLITLYSHINAFVCVPPLVLTTNDVSVSTVQK